MVCIGYGVEVKRCKENGPKTRAGCIVTFVVLFYCVDICWMIACRRTRWAVYVARMGEKRNACGVWVRRPEVSEMKQT